MTEKINPGHRAVFLDRDGTIIEDQGHLSLPGQVTFFPDTIPALLVLQQHAMLFIVTHQSGIAKGLITVEDVQHVNHHVNEHLAKAGIIIREVYCCPHNREDNCPCIKPNPYHLLQAAQKYGIDLKQSFVLGDHPHDVELAWNAGATGIYLLTGHGTKHRSELPPEAIVAQGIGEAARKIINMI